MMASDKGVRVFSSTTGQYRRELGERITEWLSGDPGVIVDEIRVVQSSDASYHCLTIVVFFNRGRK
jgi:hypothetical protein